MTRVLSVVEYLAALRAPAASELLAATGGTSLIVVDLARESSVDASDPLYHMAFLGLPVVVAGVFGEGGSAHPRDAALAAVLDLVLAPDELAVIETVVDAAPRAAVTAGLLLRSSESRSIEEGLVAESAAYSLLQGSAEFARWRARTPIRPPHSGDVRDRVLLERDGDVVSVTLDRPARRNAVDSAMRDALANAFEVVASDPSVRAVLRGAGPAFCSGGDLDEFGSREDPAAGHLVRLTRSPARLLAGIADRVEARVHGACAGGGVELAAFAGRVVAAPNAYFALPEVRLGLVPGAGGTVSLPRRIGRHRTAFLALAGARIDAETALDWGLVDAIES